MAPGAAVGGGSGKQQPGILRFPARAAGWPTTSQGWRTLLTDSFDRPTLIASGMLVGACVAGLAVLSLRVVAARSSA